MQTLKEMLSLETKFRIKNRFMAKVSFVMRDHMPEMESPGLSKKISTVNVPEKTVKPGLRHSISEPANEKLFMEAAAASATPAGKT